MKAAKLVPFFAAALLSLSVSLAADSAKKDIPPSKSGVPKSYPLKTCVVSNEELGGEMGKAVKVSYEGTDVYLCCEDCIKDFKKDPAKYVKMVKDAEPKKK